MSYNKENENRVKTLKNKSSKEQIKQRDKAKMRSVIAIIKLIRKKYRCAEEKSKNYFYQYMIPYLVTVLCEISESLNYKGELKMGYKKKNSVSLKTLLKESAKTTTTFIKSGSVIIDTLLGGGIPKGSISVFSGPNGSGKTTLLLHICNSFCMQGLKVLFLDFEHGINDLLLDSMGLGEYKYNSESNPKGKLIIARPNSFAECEQYLEGAINSDISLIVIDSATAIVGEKDEEKSIEENENGSSARIMSRLLAKYRPKLVKKRIAVLISNQMRTNLNYSGKTTLKEAGGNAIKHYADYRIMLNPMSLLKMERIEQTLDGDKKIEYGTIAEIWCEKSRYTKPKIKLKLHIVYGEGVSNYHAYKDYLLSNGIITKSGAWYTVEINENTIKKQGDEEIIDWIKENREKVRGLIEKDGGFQLIKGSTCEDEYGV